MTALVILHHTAETYGGSGGWPWTELKPSLTPVGFFFSLLCYTDVAFKMGFFFMRAGYFTPASLERKGYRRFLVDRFVRLGIPLLIFGFILGPLTMGIYSYGEGNGFWLAIHQNWRHHGFVMGPLWFVLVLLLFSVAYCAWRAVFGNPLANSARTAKPVPATIWWLAGALALTSANLAHLRFIPFGIHMFGVWIDFRGVYVFLFALGIAAWRYDWFRQLSWSHARPWVWGLAITWPALPLGTLLIHDWHQNPHPAAYVRYLSPAVLLAVWQPFVAWGIIPAWLLLFREHFNQPSAIWNWLNRRAYAVYIIHPPVLVGIAMLLHNWAAPALARFAVVGTLACFATWLLADPLVRLPGLRRVV